MSTSDPNVTQDTICTECGFNLIGKPKQGECPECRLPVLYSLPNVLLSEAAPDWISSIRSGLNWLVAGIVAYFLFTAIATIQLTSWIGEQADNFDAYEDIEPPLSHLVTNALFELILCNILCIAAWKMTAPEPGYVRPNPVRETTRITLLAAYMTGMVAVLINTVQSDALTPIVILIVVVSSVFSIIGNLAMLSYLRSLAMRIPDDSLAKQARIIQSLLIASIATVIFGGFLLMNSKSGITQDGTALVAVLTLAAAGLIMLVTGIWWILLALNFRNRFANLSQIALYNDYRKKAVRY